MESPIPTLPSVPTTKRSTPAVSMVTEASSNAVTFVVPDTIWSAEIDAVASLEQDDERGVEEILRFIGCNCETTTLELVLHPLASVTVHPYVAAYNPVIVEPVEPVDHKYEYGGIALVTVVTLADPSFDA